jgi:hypothetical protein
MDSAEILNAAKIIAPYAGWVSALYTSGAAASQDLSLCGQQGVDPDLLPDIYAQLMGRGSGNFTGLLGRYCRFSAYSATAGAAIWVVQGPTLASVTGANAPVIPVTTASVINGAGVPEPIVAGTYVDWYVTVSTRFIGFIGSSAGWLIVRPSSVGANG